jgi:lysophospholipase L1-like esterase
VRTVILLQGTNDIVQPEMPQDRCTAGPRVGADRLIGGYRELISEAHRRGVRVIGATVPPFKGPGTGWTEAGERVRQALNAWIRTSGAYDGVADVDRAVADPVDPRYLRAGYAAPDGVHLDDAGYGAVADAVDLDVL